MCAAVGNRAMVPRRGGDKTLELGPPPSPSTAPAAAVPALGTARIVPLAFAGVFSGEKTAACVSSK
jgi:hypothetical protein